MSELRVEIDDLPVDVDKDDWERDPDGVTEAVRQARSELRLEGLVEGDREPDYNTLYGEDE